MTKNNNSSLIDVHVHLAAVPDGKNGCYISPKMLKGALFRFLVRRLGLDLARPEEANRHYVQRLVDLLKTSQFVHKAVALGLDGVYDGEGNLDQQKTEFLISNDYVLETVRRFPAQLKAGVSINPQRRDALDELARCAEAGAALVKVLPNTQNFNPADEKYRAFYKELAARKLPLLSHVGYEFSLWGKDQSVGDPARTEIALGEGVTVIAAHGASFGLFFYEKYWKTLTEFVRRYPHFYWDASALSLPNRVGMLLRLRRHPELMERMIFGTDYPLPSFAYPALLAGKFKGYGELRAIKNPFDRHFRLLQILGFPL